MSQETLCAVTNILRESFAEYREKAAQYLGSHALGDFRKCPALYKKKMLGLMLDEDRPAYVFGRAAHTLVLEGVEQFRKEYARGGPVNTRTGKPYGPTSQAFLDWASAQGKPALTKEQVELCQDLYNSVHAHSQAAELLSEGIAEGVVRAEYAGIQCQIRMDWFNPFEGIVDFKTCDDLTYFEADARRYGYLHQLAFYRAVLKQKLNTTAPVHLIAVEKKEPYRCGVWRIEPAALDVAQRENEATIARLLECTANDTWPTGYEEPRTFNSF